MNEPQIGNTVRMILDLATDISGKLVEIRPDSYVVEIQRDDSFKKVKKGLKLVFQKSALVEFVR